ncbi:retrovirus-related pol polyprotein from transposon TNT 1-94, partial [Tanacetum coccineum]
MDSQSETSQTVSALKLLVLKIGEYDLCSMRMEQYLTFTDHDLWEVIVNGDSVSPVASANDGAKGLIPPKTAEHKLARKNELKAKSTLMLAIPDEHLLKFHACKDAKSLWEAIKNRFGGNKESKKMQKTILKQNYENFVASSQEGLDKTYDRFQNLISQLEIHGELDNEDLEQIDANDLEEMDLKWQVAMLTMRVRRFIKKTGRKLDLNDKETVGFDWTKIECYNCHGRGHFARECMAPRNQGNRNRDDPRRNAPVDTSTTNALVVQDGIGSSSSDSEVHTCSKNCLKSYEALQKQYDQQCEALNKSYLEIIGYQMELESLEARIVIHEKNEVVYEENIEILKYDVQSEVVHSVFNSRESDVDDNPVNDRFKIGNGPDWLFDVDSLIKTMNYVPIVAGNQTNGIPGTRDNIIADPKDSEDDACMKPIEEDESGVSNKGGEDDQATRSDTPVSTAGPSFTDDVPTSPINIAEPSVSTTNTFEEHLVERFSPFKHEFDLPHVPNVTPINDTRIFDGAYDDNEVGAEADLNNLETTMHEPKKVIQALEDPSWIEAMQEELLQFKLQKVWTMVDLPNGKRAIGTKWVFRNKKDERGIVMDVKSTFLCGTIEKEVYVCQPPSFEDPQLPDKVYKVEKALYGLHQAPRAWYETMSTYLLENGFRRGTIDKTLFIKKDKIDILSMIGSLMYLTASRPDIIFPVCACVRFQVTPKVSHLNAMKRIFRYLKGQTKIGPLVKQKDDGIFISQDKYVADILKKFDFSSVKTASTLIETNKALLKDKEVEDVDVHLYRLMIGSLMYLTASRPDIIFVVCACARRLSISWQIVANSTTKAEYVAAANCCRQVLWIQNQMLDYGFNFMNTKIHIDNESTICIMKNLVFHSKTKHIEIRHHFIRDSYEKRLIQVIKIHTNHNVVDLLTKAFDVNSDDFGVRTGGCKVNAARQDLVQL